MKISHDQASLARYLRVGKKKSIKDIGRIFEATYGEGNGAYKIIGRAVCEASAEYWGESPQQRPWYIPKLIKE